MTTVEKNELFTALYTRYYHVVIGTLYNRTRHMQLAEDLTQDTFLQLFLSMDTLKDISLQGFIMTIAINKLRDYYRTKQHRNDCLPEIPYGYDKETDPMDAYDSLMDAEQAASQLSKEERSMLYRHGYLDVPYQHDPQANVIRMRLARSRQHLREAVRKAG